jgi:hypothetical protein
MYFRVRVTLGALLAAPRSGSIPRARYGGPSTEEVIQQMHSPNIAELVQTDTERVEARTS